MLIDPKGLLNGDRIGACSDEAQLHFPRILAAANTYGRFRMSVDWLHSEVYGSFRVKPTKDQLTRWMVEYNTNFLLFVYKAPDGSLWAQWDVPAKMLGQYRAAADRKTPAPCEEELKAFRFSYAESVRMRNQADPDLISDGFANISKASKTFQNVLETPKTVRKVSHDVLVDVGVVVDAGVGVVSSPAAPEYTPKAEKLSDPRHAPFRDAILAHYKQLAGDDASWDGSEGKKLDALLKATPKLTLETLQTCLDHRAESTVQASDRPRKWIETILDYLSGPKDEFGKPLRKRPREPGTRSRSVPSSDETRQMLAREEEEKKRAREETLDYWRHCRENNTAAYQQAPNWVRQELEGAQ